MKTILLTILLIVTLTNTVYSMEFNNRRMVHPNNKDWLKEKLKDIVTPKSELYFYSVNKSQREDWTIDIVLPNNKKSSVLVLLSRDPVRWIIKKPNAHTIEAIIYANPNQSSEVLGDTPDDSRIFTFIMLEWLEKFDRYQAKCDNVYLRTEWENHIETVGRIRELIEHKKVTSLNECNSASEFLSPKILTAQEVFELENEYKKLELSKAQCIETERKKLVSKLIKLLDKTYNEGSGDIKKGQKAYLKNCKSCHGFGMKGANMATQYQWNSAFVEHGKQMKEIHQKTDANPYFQSPLFEEHYRDLHEYLYEYAGEVERK